MVCAGWYFGKTAGLWGTINNEPSDDFLASSDLVEHHVADFTRSWALRPESCGPETNQTAEVSEPDEDIVELCDSLFNSKVSPFHACYERVHSHPFHDMCLHSNSVGQVCTSAVAYIQACTVVNTPLRIPDVCVK